MHGSQLGFILWLSAPDLERKPGGQRRYADIAIEAALMIRMVFHLPLRQTEGFLYSLMQLLDVDLPIPDHTTLSRRLQTLGEIHFQPATHGPLHLLIDSTGLKIHVGHLRKPPRNRAWRKLHLAVDADSGQIVASELTHHRIRDATPVPVLWSRPITRWRPCVRMVSTTGRASTRQRNGRATAKRCECSFPRHATPG